MIHIQVVGKHFYEEASFDNRGVEGTAEMFASQRLGITVIWDSHNTVITEVGDVKVHIGKIPSTDKVVICEVFPD